MRVVEEQPKTCRLWENESRVVDAGEPPDESASVGEDGSDAGEDEMESSPKRMDTMRGPGKL